MGARLPPRLPPLAGDRGAPGTTPGDGLHGNRDRGGSGGDRRSLRPARAAVRALRLRPAQPLLRRRAPRRQGVEGGRQALLEAGLGDAGNRPAIVYCGTRRDTDEVAEALREVGLRALAYHAGMEAEERTSAQHRFMSGEADVVVATNAFGMGVDKADVRSVWHMAIPTSLEAYYQEAGRAGRDGLPARAVLLAMRADLGRLVRFNEQRSGDPELAIACERGWRDYRTIKSFIYSDNCRRRSVLDHFDDGRAGQPLARCCDVCDPTPDCPIQSQLRSDEAVAPRRPPAPAPTVAARRGPVRRRSAPGEDGERQPGLHHRPRQHPAIGRRDSARRRKNCRRLAASAPVSSPNTPPMCWR